MPKFSTPDDILKHLDNHHGTKIEQTDLGRVDISLDQHQSGALVSHLRNLVSQRIGGPALQSPPDLHKPVADASTPTLPPLRGLNVVVQIVGSRGDVQPFVALGKALKETYGHRVRIATHATFKDMVENNGLEFFNITGDPAQLMAFMVKNPGLMPGFETIKKGDIGRQRTTMYEIMKGCWRSCLEPGDGMNYHIHHNNSTDFYSEPRIIHAESDGVPFIADAIIANPPSFAHIHLAERLGLPLHIVFTMPWTPTHAFPHPIANIHSTNADASTKNFVSYGLVELMTWQGIGDIVNDFRKKYLHLDPLNLSTAPGLENRLNIPHTYCWSPALIPKPSDWGPNIDIAGFFFLPRLASYKPDPKLEAFLAAGKPPVYIGFGSIVVADAKKFTKLIYDAVKMAGVRALISQGWGGLGDDKEELPEGVLLLGDTPHDWLFPQVCAVVHHGGAGTTAAGLAAGKPTVVVPFFGDQPFWGSMVARSGAGPIPVPYKQLTAEKLANAITEALKPSVLEKAEEMGRVICRESGCEIAAASIQRTIENSNLHCDLFPDQVAVFRLKKTIIKISSVAAALLTREGLVNYKDLRLYRPREYDTEDRTWALPLLAIPMTVIETVGGVVGGLADYPMLAKHAIQHANARIHHHNSIDSATGAKAVNGEKQENHVEQHPVLLPPTHSLDHSQLEKLPTTNTLSTSATSPNGMINGSASTSADTTPLPPHPSAPRESTANSTFHRPSLYPTSSHNWHTAPATTVVLSKTFGPGFGMGAVIGSLLNFPALLSINLTRGFHRVPAFYGDPTVRPFPRVTGFQSGTRAAASTFVQGWTDGVVGLVKLPFVGAQRRSGSGKVEGALKGMAQAGVGLICKPAEGCWGVPAYFMQGVHKEIEKQLGKNVGLYEKEVREREGARRLEVFGTGGETQAFKKGAEGVKEIWKGLVRDSERRSK